MDPAFSFSLPKRTEFTVLGLRLRPLTVGHLFVLLELESNVPDHCEELNYHDTLWGAFVCSQPHRDARRILLSPIGRRVLKRWLKMLARKFTLTLEDQRIGFLNYLLHQLERPERDRMGMPDGEMRVPMAWRLLAMLQTEFGLTKREALNTEVRYAITLWAVEADRRGIDKIASERQLAFREWVNQQEAARKGKS